MIFPEAGNPVEVNSSRHNCDLLIVKEPVLGFESYRPARNLHILNPEVVSIQNVLYRFLVGPLTLQLSPIITHFLAHLCKLHGGLICIAFCLSGLDQKWGKIIRGK